jgi:hypothetical protein
MTTIDQRLLIPIAQTVVWDYISDISKNPSWQADCQNISYLTSKREGPGTRWRYATKKGRENVVEITAWYNGLGYEYVFIDGLPYRNNRGRIRLQEIAEGTIVQWTFTYEVGGMLSGLRNNSRQLENTMAASLKTLYRQVKQYATDSTFEAKSLMRDAPDVAGRAQYKPRHPTVAAKPSAETDVEFHPVGTPEVFDEPPVLGDDGQAIQTYPMDEPPVSVDDTRPRPAIVQLDASVPVSAIPADMNAEPEFLADMREFEPPRDAHDTVRNQALDSTPQAVDATTSAEAAEAAPQVASIPPETAVHEPTPAATAPEEGLDTAELVAPPSASQSIEPASVVSPASESASATSIWDVFGVQRPSETREIQAVSADESEPVVTSTTSMSSTSRQGGLRVRLRRNLVHLRRPL